MVIPRTFAQTHNTFTLFTFIYTFPGLVSIVPDIQFQSYAYTDTLQVHTHKQTPTDITNCIQNSKPINKYSPCRVPTIVTYDPSIIFVSAWWRCRCVGTGKKVWLRASTNNVIKMDGPGCFAIFRKARCLSICQEEKIKETAIQKQALLSKADTV